MACGVTTCLQCRDFGRVRLDQRLLTTHHATPPRLRSSLAGTGGESGRLRPAQQSGARPGASAPPAQ
eukprot:SAG11_NODE_814_length_7033_cov_57.557254_4_plen_67_part_00